MVNLDFETFLKTKFNTFKDDLKAEWNYQDKKFPYQEHTIETWISIIGEEFGELCKASLENDLEKRIELIHLELIQIFTLCIRIKYSLYGFTQKDLQILKLII